MKILHTADWHLGKRLDRFERHAEQKEVMQEICEIAEREEVDAVLIAGDLYDTYNPPVESVELFYKTVKSLSAQGQRAVIAIAGNHDSPSRVEAPDPLARDLGIIFAGFPTSEIRPFTLPGGLAVTRSAPGFVEIKTPQHPTPLRLILAPYANEVRLRKALDHKNYEQELREALALHWQGLADQYLDDQGINLMIAHLFMINPSADTPEEPEDEKPINVGPASAIYTRDLPAQLQYVAMGHLHRPQSMGGGPCPVVYPGSPLSYSFSEAGQQKRVQLLHLTSKAEVEIENVPLQSGIPLVKKRFEDIDEALTWLSQNQNCYVELTLVSDDYISGKDRSRIAKAHPRIIGPIPELRSQPQNQSSRKAIDLNKSTEELFKDFFRSKNAGQRPNQEIMGLFREVIAGEESQ